MTSSTIVLPRTTSEKPTTTRQREYCGHYWEINAAEGPVSLGICRYCGEKREFHNYLPDCLADSDKEKYEEWLAKHGRERPRKRGNVGVI